MHHSQSGSGGGGGDGGGLRPSVVRKMRVPELKQALRARGASLKGRKADLLERLLGML